jgi:glycosyltransferase involved in cell wall biosynthesis
MKILYISQYFFPEIGATTNRVLANVRYLAGKGHDVTVLTEMPNHPRGIIFAGYKNKLFMKEMIENFSVLRVWVYTNPKKNFLTRLLFYFSFMHLGFIYAIITWKKYDLVYVTSPPLFAGVIGLWIKKLLPHTKFVFEVRDLWPDAAIEMGELNNKALIKLSYFLEKSFYRNADHIIAVTESFKKMIVKKGYDSKKVSVVRNGSDLIFKIVNVPVELSQKYNSESNFIIAYAGNLGIAQNLLTVLKTAEKFINENVIFLIIGTGPQEKLLKDYALDHDINNVSFIGELPKEEVSKYFSLADCGLIPLKDISVFERTIPSKLFDYMSASLPILLGVKGEANDILLDSRAGIAYYPDDPDDLKDKILFLKSNPHILADFRANGRKFVEKHFDRNKLAAELENIITLL